MYVFKFLLILDVVLYCKHPITDLFTNHITQKTKTTKKKTASPQIPTLTLPNPIITPNKEPNTPVKIAASGTIIFSL